MKNNGFCKPILNLFLAIFVLVAMAQQAAASITKVAGDVYRFHNVGYYSLIVVTNEGVVIVDPISPAASRKLIVELQEITDKPITHLIYSHSHHDHAAGGGGFEAKTIIAHENAPELIMGVQTTMRFKDTYELKLGGKTLELKWLGIGHAKDLIAVVVRPENVAFVVDIGPPKKFPYMDFPDSDIDGLIEQLRVVESLDFDIVAPGHGNTGVKLDITNTRVYMEKLRQEVLFGLREGKTLRELQKVITMDEYKEWASYSYLGQNIKGMARYLQEKDKL